MSLLSVLDPVFSPYGLSPAVAGDHVVFFTGRLCGSSVRVVAYHRVVCLCRLRARPDDVDVPNFVVRVPRWRGCPTERWVFFLESEMSKFMQKMVSDAEGTASPAVAVDKEFTKMFPCLWEMMSVCVFDGKKRTPASLLLFVEGGLVKGCLNDRQYHRKAFMTSFTVTGVMGAFEAALVAGDLDWRNERK